VVLGGAHVLSLCWGLILEDASLEIEIYASICLLYGGP
jgi:hypothetical protein